VASLLELRQLPIHKGINIIGVVVGHLVYCFRMKVMKPRPVSAGEGGLRLRSGLGSVIRLGHLKEAPTPFPFYHALLGKFGVCPVERIIPRFRRNSLRSAALVPPQMPCRSLFVNAYSRHSLITGQDSQIRFAM
jgi:hypothetical protein